MKAPSNFDDYLSRLKNSPFLTENWATILLIVIISIPSIIFFVQGLLYGFDEIEHAGVSGLFFSAIFYNLFIILIVILIVYNNQYLLKSLRFISKLYMVKIDL